MNKNEARSLIMEYLYDEMNQTDKENFEQILSDSPDLQKELKEMQDTRNLLGQLTSADTEEQPSLFEDRSAKPNNRWNSIRKTLIPGSNSGRVFLAAAAVLLISFLLASIVNLTVSTTGNGLTISFGSIPQAEQSGFSDEEVALLIEEVQRENAILATQLIEQAQAKQAEQFEDVMRNVVSYFEEQRMKDLQLVDNGISRLEEETYNRFRQTDEALVDLIYAINLQQD